MQRWTFEIRLGYGARTEIIDGSVSSKTMLGAKQRATRRFNRGRYAMPNWTSWKRLPSGAVKYARDFTGMVVGTMIVSRPLLTEHVRREYRAMMAKGRGRVDR